MLVYLWTIIISLSSHKYSVANRMNITLYFCTLHSNEVRTWCIKVQHCKNWINNIIDLKKLKFLHKLYYLFTCHIFFFFYIKTGHEKIVVFYNTFHSKLPSRLDALTFNLAASTIHGNPHRRFKRYWCRDVLK